MVQPTAMPEPSLRGARLFRAIGRRLAKQNSEEDSADSESSSDSGSSANNNSQQNTLRRMMASLSIRSSPSKRSHEGGSRKILRQPITYTYMRGMSGLPTIRVPKAGTMRAPRDAKDARRVSCHT